MSKPPHGFSEECCTCGLIISHRGIKELSCIPTWTGGHGNSQDSRTLNVTPGGTKSVPLGGDGKYYLPSSLFPVVREQRCSWTSVCNRFQEHCVESLQEHDNCSSDPFWHTREVCENVEHLFAALLSWCSFSRKVRQLVPTREDISKLYGKGD